VGRFKQGVKMNIKQNAYTTVEVAIGVLAGLIILLGSVTAYAYIKDARTNNDLSLLTRLGDATQKYGAANTTFNSTNVSSALLASNNFFPPELVDSANGVIKNQFGGTITPEAGTLATAGDSINFSFTNAPADQCSNLLNAAAAQADFVSVGTAVIKSVDVTYNPNTVGSICSAQAGISQSSSGGGGSSQNWCGQCWHVYSGSSNNGSGGSISSDKIEYTIGFRK
jgi:PilS N terminal